VPSALTHYIFIKKATIGRPSFTKILGAQGADPFFFYGYLHSSRPNIKDIRSFGNILHHTPCDETTKYFIDYINKQNSSTKTLLFEYLDGYLSHFVLDHTFHPYVFYFTGIDYNTSKVQHAALESSLDTVFANLYKIKIKNASDIFFLDDLPLKEISKMFSYVATELNVVNIDENAFYYSVKDMRKVLNLLYSKSGIKKALLNLFMKNSLINAMSRPKKILKKDYLYITNKENSTWLNPANGASLNCSVFDLFNQSIALYQNNISPLIELATKYDKLSFENSILEGENFDGLHVGEEMRYQK